MLAIVSVNYNNYEVTLDFIESLKKQNDKDFVLYLIDLSTKRQKKTYPPFVRFISCENKGYAFGINTGVKQAILDGHEELVAMNNDTDFPKTFVSDIRTSLRVHPDAIIGAKIYYYEGYEYHKERYAHEDLGNVFWYAGGVVDWAHALTYHRGVDEVDRGQYDRSEKTDFVTGCFMAFTSMTYQLVGPWDESYFMYYEDADWCERAKRKDVPLIYDPSLVLYHKNAQSSDGSGSSLHVRYQERNRLTFGLKYAPWRTKIHLILNFLKGSSKIKYQRSNIKK